MTFLFHVLMWGRLQPPSSLYTNLKSSVEAWHVIMYSLKSVSIVLSHFLSLRQLFHLSQASSLLSCFLKTLLWHFLFFLFHSGFFTSKCKKCGLTHLTTELIRDVVHDSEVWNQAKDNENLRTDYGFEPKLKLFGETYKMSDQEESIFW